MPFFIRSTLGQQRFRAAQALAYNMVFNSRNLEDRWYLVWDHLLNHLIEDNPNLHVAPQYSLWYRPKNPNSSMASTSIAGPGPSNIPRKESRYPTPLPEDVIPELQTHKRQTETSRKARLASVGITPEQFATAGKRPIGRGTLDVDVDSSSSSHTDVIQNPDVLTDFFSDFPAEYKDETGSAATEHVADAPARIPDFAILHTITVPDEAAVLSGKFKVQELRIPVLIEIKSYIERHMVDEEKVAKIELVVQRAVRQALEQAAALFLSHPNIQSVTSIATCGPYWSYAELRPIDIPPNVWMELNASPDYPYISSLDSTSSTSHVLDMGRWSDIAEIEDVKSDSRLEKLQSALVLFPTPSKEETPILA